MNDGKAFFHKGAVPPTCPRCGIHFQPGDAVQTSDAGPDGLDREHIDCDNPQNGVIDASSPVGRAFRRARGEKS